MRASQELIQINQDQCLPPCINACSFEKEFDQVIELEDVPAYQPPNSPVTPIIFGGSVHNAGRDIDAKGKVFKRVTKFIDTSINQLVRKTLLHLSFYSPACSDTGITGGIQ